MKKGLLTVVCIWMVVVSFAQPGLYFNVAGGYSMPALQQTQQAITFQPNGTDPAGSTIIPLINQNISDSASLKFKSNAYQGYSTGGIFSFSAGYFINPYVGFEFGMTTIVPQKSRGTSIYDDNVVLGPKVRINSTTWSHGISTSISARFNACKPSAKVVPYGRFAIVLPVWGTTVHELDIQSTDFLKTKMPASAQIRTETKSVVSVGFNASAGVGYNITKWVRIFGEVAGQYLFVRSGTTTITKYNLTFNGETNDMIPTYSTFSKVTEFVDRLDENSNTTAFGKTRKVPNSTNNVNEDAPRQELRRAANFSAFSFNVGLTFTIDNKLLKKKKNRQPMPVHP